MVETLLTDPQKEHPLRPTKSRERSTFGGLGFQRKMLAVPLIAAMGFGVLLLLGLWLGGYSLDALSEIEETHFPLVELNRDLEALLQGVQRELSNAVASKDVAGFESAKRVGDEFLSRLDEARGSGLVAPRALASLRNSFASYYALAQGTSSHLIQRGFDGTIAVDIRSMGDQYSALPGELENRTQAARQSIAHHFAEARRMQHLFLEIVVGVLIACTVILFVMSRVVAMSVSKPLFDVIEAVERAQGGDLTAQPLTTNEAGIAGDEIVGLQRGFDSMISNLRAMVANTGESALGLAETAQQLRQSGSKLHDDNATQERALVRTVEFMELVRNASTESLNSAKSLSKLAVSCTGSVAELNNSIDLAAGSIDERYEDIERAELAVVELSRTIPTITQEVHDLRSASPP